MQEILIPKEFKTKDVESKRVRVSLAIAVLAAILTPSAYLLGLSYYQGYLSAFGVEPDGFPISAPDIYVFSYQTVGYFLLTLGGLSVKAINKVFSPQFIYVTLTVLSLLVGGIYLLFRLGRTGPHPRIQRALAIIKMITSWLHWKNNDFTKSVGIVGVASYLVVLLSASVGAAAIFWWILPFAAHNKGHSVAQERINIFIEKGCYVEPNKKWDTCVAILDEEGDVVQEGLLIAINDKEVALFKKDGSYIFRRKENLVLKRKFH